MHHRAEQRVAAGRLGSEQKIRCPRPQHTVGLDDPLQRHHARQMLRLQQVRRHLAQFAPGTRLVARRALHPACRTEDQQRHDARRQQMEIAMLVIFRQRGCLRHPDNQQQRIALQLAVTADAVNAISPARAFVGTVRAFLEFIEDPGAAQVLPGGIFAISNARADNAVEPDQTDSATRPQIDVAVKLGEIGRVEGDIDSAAK